MYTTYSYYDILEISENASIEEIKQKFQKLLLHHHPDKFQQFQQKSLLKPTTNNKSDEISNVTNSNKIKVNDDKINKILEAWHVLRDPESRKIYDNNLREVDLDDMEYNEDMKSYSISCRCNGLYIISEDDLDQGA
ncbi:5764_t:CDS:2, partial [Diversispora eburnea]